MSQVLSLQSRSIAARLARDIAQPLAQQSAKTREREDARYRKLMPVLQMMREGATDAEMQGALVALGCSRSTACRRVRALRAMQSGDAHALAPKYHGRPIVAEAWHVRAIELYRQRSQPTAGGIAAKLWAEGVRLTRKDGTPIKYASFVARIRTLLDHLPKDRGEFSAARLGASYRQGNHLPRKRRDWSDMAVGEAWVSDGHKLKVLCRNVLTGNYYRLEITPILDLRSNYWFATWFANSESANSTVNLFCSVVTHYRKVPLFFYTDNGPGFRNERTAAMFARLGVDHRTARPGAPYSKGIGEAIFRRVIDDFARVYWPDAYCGTDATDDVIARYRTKEKRGEIYIPTDREVMASLKQYRLDYNAKPQPYSYRLAGACPDDLIRDLVPDEVPVRPELLLWEEKVLTVRKATVKWTVSGEAFIYSSKLLTAHESERVTVLLDGEDASRIWLRDGNGVYLGEATRNEDVGFVQPSVHAAQRQKNLELAMQRKDALKARIRSDFDASHVIEPDGEGSVSDRIQSQGHTLTIPAPLPFAAIEYRPQSLNPATLPRLQAELAEEAAEVETETAGQRYARAAALEAAQDQGAALDAEDARWLALYTTTPEFRAQRLIAEARAEAREEQRAQSAATDAPSFTQPQEP